MESVGSLKDILEIDNPKKLLDKKFSITFDDLNWLYENTKEYKTDDGKDNLYPECSVSLAYAFHSLKESTNKDKKNFELWIDMVNNYYQDNQSQNANNNLLSIMEQFSEKGVLREYYEAFNLAEKHIDNLIPRSNASDHPDSFDKGMHHYFGAALSFLKLIIERQIRIDNIQSDTDKLTKYHPT